MPRRILLAPLALVAALTLAAPAGAAVTASSITTPSASPFFSMSSRVSSSGTTFMTSRLTEGGLRQYLSYASRTTSTPG